MYFTKDITPESLVKIYEALSVAPKEGQRVAVKISTGESAQSNYLRPEFIKDLVQKVGGNIVECNTAYGGNRSTTANHKRAIEQRGFGEIATVDIMDEEGTINLPVTDTKHLQYDIVGSHVQNYDFMINLAHFKGHAMGGFGGVLKNQSIGVASSSGKLYHLVYTSWNEAVKELLENGVEGFTYQMSSDGDDYLLSFVGFTQHVVMLDKSLKLLACFCNTTYRQQMSIFDIPVHYETICEKKADGKMRIVHPDVTMKSVSFRFSYP